MLGLSEADAGQIIAAADVNGDGSLSIRGNNVNLHMHYGRNWKRTQTKLPSINSLSHERGSELSERASEQVSAAECAKQAGRSKQTSERYKQMSERTSEWPSTSVCILGCFESLICLRSSVRF